jgi:large conductance mechanosensitive channel
VFKEFRNFLLRGNVVDLAVAVVIGAAFGAVIASFSNNLLGPLLSIPGTVDFSKWKFTISNSVFHPGLFLNAVIAFILTAAAVFFGVVKPVNMLMERRKTSPDVESPTKDCPECLSNIPVGAKRCAFCTSVVGVS